MKYYCKKFLFRTPEQYLTMKKDIVVFNIQNDTAKGILKGEMAKRGISRQQLAELLSMKGSIATRASIDNKFTRGTFSADFFLDCLRIIGCTDVGINYPD